MPFGWIFALMALTTYRATRLIVKDNFPLFLWIRTKLAGDEEDGIEPASWSPWWLQYLVTCYWCTSVWVAGAMTLAVALTIGLPYPLLVWGGLCALAPLLSHLEEFWTRK